MVGTLPLGALGPQNYYTMSTCDPCQATECILKTVLHPSGTRYDPLQPTHSHRCLSSPDFRGQQQKTIHGKITGLAQLVTSFLCSCLSAQPPRPLDRVEVPSMSIQGRTEIDGLDGRG